MKLHWMHADCLNADWLGEAPAVFVFDDEQIAAAGWGLKRLLFLYECLLELPVEIYHGPTVETLLRLADGKPVVTVATPDPWLRERISELGKVEIKPAPVFVELTGRVDLKRFSRYWTKAEPQLLR